MHPNEELARAGYAAFNRKDLPAVMSMLSDDVVFVVPGRSIQSGRFEGKPEVGRYFKIVGKHTRGTHSLDVVDVLANDHRAVSLLRGHGRHEDKIFDQLLIHDFLIEEGLVARVTIVPSDLYAFDEFWS